MNPTQQPPQPTPALSVHLSNVAAALDRSTALEHWTVVLAVDDLRDVLAAARAYTALVPLVEAAARYREAEMELRERDRNGTLHGDTLHRLYLAKRSAEEAMFTAALSEQRP